MAHDSKRELIIQNLVGAIALLDDIRTVERVHPSFTELKGYAPTQLPFVGVIGSLPKPVELPGGRQISIQQITSDLYVDLLFFGIERDDPDRMISFYADELWRAVYADPSRGKRALETAIEPEINTGIMPPYIAFFMTVRVKYLHDKKGI